MERPITIWTVFPIGFTSGAGATQESHRPHAQTAFPHSASQSGQARSTSAVAQSPPPKILSCCADAMALLPLPFRSRPPRPARARSLFSPAVAALLSCWCPLNPSAAPVPGAQPLLLGSTRGHEYRYGWQRRWNHDRSTLIISSYVSSSISTLVIVSSTSPSSMFKC